MYLFILENDTWLDIKKDSLYITNRKKEFYEVIPIKDINAIINFSNKIELISKKRDVLIDKNILLTDMTIFGNVKKIYFNKNYFIYQQRKNDNLFEKSLLYLEWLIFTDNLFYYYYDPVIPFAVDIQKRTPKIKKLILTSNDFLKLKSYIEETYINSYCNIESYDNFLKDMVNIFTSIVKIWSFFWLKNNNLFFKEFHENISNILKPYIICWTKFIREKFFMEIQPKLRMNKENLKILLKLISEEFLYNKFNNGRKWLDIFKSYNNNLEKFFDEL